MFQILPLEDAGSLAEQKQLIQLTDEIVGMMKGHPYVIGVSAIYSALLSVESIVHDQQLHEAARRIASKFETFAKQCRTRSVQ